eukprot:7280631-Karenia_brevis.AAC.1
MPDISVSDVLKASKSFSSLLDKYHVDLVGSLDGLLSKLTNDKEWVSDQDQIDKDQDFENENIKHGAEDDEDKDKANQAAE